MDKAGGSDTGTHPGRCSGDMRNDSQKIDCTHALNHPEHFRLNRFIAPVPFGIPIVVGFMPKLVALVHFERWCAESFNPFKFRPSCVDSHSKRVPGSLNIPAVWCWIFRCSKRFVLMHGNNIFTFLPLPETPSFVPF